MDRYRRDAGLSVRALARAADVSQAHASEVFAGRVEPSISVLTSLATALGTDLSIRVFPQTGPAIRDGIQGRILEELLRIADRGWLRHPEVGVHRPARGFIDVALASQERRVVVATEIQSRLDRLEQSIRWSALKASSLPSSTIWPVAGPEPAIGQLLVIRSTETTRSIARRFEASLQAAYPAPAAAAYAALTTPDAPWPGSSILWAEVHGDVARILPRPPRGVALGRSAG